MYLLLVWAGVKAAATSAVLVRPIFSGPVAFLALGLGEFADTLDTSPTSPAFIKASVYLLVAWLCPHGQKPENLMREWAAQGKLFSFHVEKAQNQANKHLLIFSQ